MGAAGAQVGADSVVAALQADDCTAPSTTSSGPAAVPHAGAGAGTDCAAICLVCAGAHAASKTGATARMRCRIACVSLRMVPRATISHSRYPRQLVAIAYDSGRYVGRAIVSYGA